MTRDEARSHLLRWRPGMAVVDDPELQEALALVQQDDALRTWWDKQQAFHRETAAVLKGLPVPDPLRDAILRRAKLVRIPIWRKPAVLAMAAAFVLLLGISSIVVTRPAEDSFSTFRSRMVRTVLRQYTMDIQTNDMSRIRQFLAQQRAPSDYVLPERLAALPAAGAGVLRWQDQPVSMVCLDSKSKGILFLFVVDRASVKQAPGARQFAEVSRLTTVSWSDGGRTYILAGHGDRQWLEQQL